MGWGAPLQHMGYNPTVPPCGSLCTILIDVSQIHYTYAYKYTLYTAMIHTHAKRYNF